MRRLTRADLWSLEDYAARRAEFRARVMTHKQHRRLALGDHLTLCFEDRLTIQYQVQEMLRIERIFEAEGIEAELDAYNPLIPDGGNWKATLMIEYADAEERRAALARLVGVEHQVWVRVHGFGNVRARADEDMERSNADKTSAVHFLRFDLNPEMIAAVRAGAAIGAWVDHPACRFICEPVPDAVRDALAADLGDSP